MINTVTLVGRLVRDLELKKTTNGTSTCGFTLACDKYSKNSPEKEANFFNCVAWNKTAENMVKYLHKGSKIAIVGHLNQRSYQNRDGKTVNIVEVIVDQIDFGEKQSGQAQSNYVVEKEPEPIKREKSPNYIDEDAMPF